jgi:hypothetical protein
VGGGVEVREAELDYDRMAQLCVQGDPIQIRKQIFRIVPMVDLGGDLGLLTERKTLEEKMVALEQSKMVEPDGPALFAASCKPTVAASH